MNDAFGPASWLLTYLGHLEEGEVLRPGSVDEVLARVLARKFRRTAADRATLADARAKIAARWLREEPLEFSVPFGCYKNALAPAAPLPDWAEVFNAAYLVEYAGAIAERYAPGVRIVFTYSSVGVIEANRLRPDAQETYVERFRELLRHFNDRCSRRRVTLQVLDVAALYAPGEAEAELAANLLAVEREWRQMPATLRLAKLARAERNLAVAPQSAAETQRSAMLIEAVDRLERRRWFNKHSDRIQLVFVRGPSKSVHLGSCRASQCQPLAGVGLLRGTKGDWMPTIASVRSYVGLRARGFLDPPDALPAWLPALAYVVD